MNTKIIFTYRSGNNDKTSSAEYILSGILKPEIKAEILSTFGDGENPMIPNQIDKRFKNCCPYKKVKNVYNTYNGDVWNDKMDHVNHGILIEEVEKPINCSMEINEFADQILNIDFDLDNV